MTDSTSSTTPPLPGPEHGEGPDHEHGPEYGQPRAVDAGRVKRFRRWAGRRERRIAAGVAAVALIGAGGLALVAAHEEHGREHHITELADGHGRGGHDGGHRGGRHQDGEQRDGGRQDGRHGDGGRQDDRQGKGQQGQPQTGRHQQDGVRPGGVAPAPLPSLAASAALEKAQGAVPGGRVESLKQVARQGGGSAWAVVVLGQDGVRHLVTVDDGGQMTGNTVLNGTGDGTGR